MNQSFYTAAGEDGHNYFSQIEQWLLNNNPDISSIPEDLDLIENRLIDSLRFMEFIFFLETLSGNAIDIAQIQIDNFRTIQSILRSYVSSSEIIQAALSSSCKGISHLVQPDGSYQSSDISHSTQDERCA